MNQIVFKEKDWKELEYYLTERNDVESGIYAMFKTSLSNNSKRFLVTQIIIPDDNDYYKRSSVSVAFKPEFTEKAFQQCEITNGHLLDIHTHPWSSQVNFSSTDDHEAAQTKIPYMNKYLPKTLIAFIVFGKSPVIAEARFWDKASNKLSYINRIVVI